MMCLALPNIPFGALLCFQMTLAVLLDPFASKSEGRLGANRSIVGVRMRGEEAPWPSSALGIVTGKKNQKNGFVEKLQVQIFFSIFSQFFPSIFAEISKIKYFKHLPEAFPLYHHGIEDSKH